MNSYRLQTKHTLLMHLAAFMPKSWTADNRSAKFSFDCPSLKFENKNYIMP